MRVGVGAPRAGSDTGARGMINLLKADPWLSVKPDSNVTERIATHWNWDGPRTTLRLTLRPDVYFHDGTLITPDVAAATLRATISAPRAVFSFKSIVDVRGEGKDTVVIELKERNGFILSDLASTLVTKPDHADIGTGPFQVVKRQGEDAQLVAFPKYYRGQPPLAGIDVTNYPTQRNAWTALLRGDIDMLYEVSLQAVDFVRAESTVKTYSFPRPYYIPLVFNVRKPAFKDPRVRQAINLAIDRQTLVKDGMNGRGSPADGPVWPLHWAYSKPTVAFDYDPAEARRLLDAAGFPARVTARTPVPMRLTFSCLVFANDSRFERIAVLVQKQLADVGIEMQLVPVSLDTMGKRANVGDFDTFIFEMAGRSLGWVYEFWRSHPEMVSDSGYRAADTALDRLKAAGSDDEIRSAVTEVLRVLHDDPPAAFLAWQEQSRAVSTKFDVAVEEKRDILANLWQWRPAGAK